MEARGIYTAGYKKGIKPDPYINYVDWSNTYRMLPQASSVEPGRYRTSRTPYVEEILMELSPQSPTQEVVVIKPTQMGFTEIANNFLMAVAHLYPAPCMMVMPNDDMVKRHSKKKIATSVKSMPCLKGIISDQKAKDGGNTLLLKEFPGGSWTFTGANSPASARSDSIKNLIIDDYDGMPLEAGEEGDTGGLFKNRTDAFGSKRKIYMNSTPTVKGASNIETEFEDSSQGYFHVPCPHCGEFQYLIFGGKDYDHGIKFEYSDSREVTKIWYVCKFCKGEIEEYQKTKMMIKGKYVHLYPDRKKRGFKVNSLYSPVGWLSWVTIAEELLKAKGKPLKLKKWMNCRMAETWEADGDQPEWTKLIARAEPYNMRTIPRGGLFICAGVDTQDNRLEVVVKAYGRDEETWLIDFEVIWGDPDGPEVWKRLTEILDRHYEHDSGAVLQIVSMAIDTQGHKTNSVYKYVRAHAPRVIGIQGASSKNKPIIGRPTKQDIDYSGKKMENGVDLWPIGTDTAKQLIYSRLKQEKIPGQENQPGYFHFPQGLEEEYYKQLAAEKLVTKHKKGYSVQEWEKTRERNEALDIEVYCYGAAIRAGMPRVNWDDLENSLVIPEKEEVQQRVTAPQRRVARSRFMSR